MAWRATADIDASLAWRSPPSHTGATRVAWYGPPTSFTAEYAIALRRHLEQPGEAGLRAAYDLGRRALGAGVSLIELVAIHHDARLEVLTAPREQLPEADAFLREALGAFEIAERGYWDAQRAAALERERVDVLARLNAAHLAVLDELGLQARLRAVCDQAVALVDGAGARLVIGRPDEALQSDRGDIGPSAEGTIRVAVPVRRGPAELIVWPRAGADFGEADRAVLAQLSLLAAGALDDARWLDRERTSSVQLQRSLLPPALPVVAGLSVAARYLASERSNQVGGDWYDLIPLGGSAVAAIVGDVMGHGLQEASLMAAVRVAFHAYAIEDAPAPAVVERVDRLFTRLAPDHLATVVLCHLDLTGPDLTVVNAGHPPPVRIDPDGRASMVEAGRSLPLGVQPDDSRRAGDPARLEPGTKLLLYTDGLTERVDRRGGDSDRALLDAVAGCTGSVNELCDRALAALVPTGQPTDDTCLLAVEVTGRPG